MSLQGQTATAEAARGGGKNRPDRVNGEDSMQAWRLCGHGAHDSRRTGPSAYHRGCVRGRTGP